MTDSANWPFLDKQSETNFQELINCIANEQATAFIGAGLAQQAGLPGWPGLLEALYSASTLSPQPFNPRTALKQFGQLQDNLVGDFLPIVRNLLNPPGLQLPQSYNVLSDIPFDRFATTNFDELLHILAVGVRGDQEHSIFEYPSPGLLNKNYFYLHGRLKSAKTPNDLVLSEVAYARAYMNDSELSRLLKLLLDEPVLFVGFSLTDYDLLNEIRQNKRYRIVARDSDGVRSERYQAEPKWFAILPANPNELVQPTLQERIKPVELDLLRQLAQDKANELDDSGIKAIWYDWS